MQPFTTLTAVAAPLDIANIDTDQLLPARFLKKPRSAGYGGFLFQDERRRGPDFPLAAPRAKGRSTPSSMAASAASWRRASATSLPRTRRRMACSP
jgi:hypothetical protein